MALVDDADGHEQLARADVEPAVDEEIEVRLFELELAFLFAAFDDRVLDFELGDEADAIGEAVGEQQHEPAEVDERVGVGRVHELQVHVAGQRGERAGGRAIGRCGGFGRLGVRAHGTEADQERGRGHKSRLRLCRSTRRRVVDYFEYSQQIV